MTIHDILFSLLRLSLGTRADEMDLSALTNADWKEVIDLSFDQGVAALSVDGLGCANDNDGSTSLTTSSDNDNQESLELALDSPELEDLKYEWFGACFENEQTYEEHLKVIEKLALLYNEQSVRMLLLKGYGLSLNYPVPEHRISGDIDIYLYGKGGLGDELVRERFGCEVKQNEDKHSVFSVGQVSVENHACFVNDTVHPSLRGLNDFLVSEAEKGLTHTVGGSQIVIPSPMFNALFIPYHCAGHFVHGEASVRQLCDWACFVLRYGAEVDWDKVRELSQKCGFLKFYCCLNGIVQEHLGVPAELLPDWPRNKKLEARVLEEILAPRKVVKSLAGKVWRYFSSRWKYKMVYNDNMLMSSFRLAKSYLRLKDDTAESIWEK